MTTIAPANQLPPKLSAEVSKAVGKSVGDSRHLAELRNAASQIAEELDPPTSMERPWKYTDLSEFSLEGYEPAIRAPGVATTTMSDARAKESGLSALVEVTDSTPTHVERLDGFSAGCAQDEGLSDICDEHLGMLVTPGSSLFSALHYAFLSCTTAINVPANVELDAPVKIVRRESGSGVLAAPHTMIVTGANSRLNVIEEWHSGDGPLLVLPAVEILPGEGSQVRYTSIYRWGENTRVFSEQRTITAKDSTVTNLSVALGGSKVKSHIISSLEGRGSHSEIQGLYVGGSEQQFDLYTIQDHIAADTTSDLLYKSALRERAHSVYYGLTKVGLEAKNADANQENRNLLLSKTAKADSDPVLEILTHDVIRAAHGATAGPVDEEQLYYMGTRGLDPEQSEQLLVSGFLAEVLDRIPDRALRSQLGAAIGEPEEVLI
ncbi:MAG TPA: Fe-S cluster assembly protein SufD [Dehalococcoidia bacterium]|nr:Fe-S cluster assembly protein SufD [Dehalococcoidia bacterium]